MNKAAIAAVVLCPALASAQPAEPPPAPADPLAACKAQRLEIAYRAAQTTDAQERGRLLSTMPDCSKPGFAQAPAAEAGPHERGTTFELAAGAAIITGGGDTQLVHGIGGFNLGVGRFVTPQVALTLRMAGATGLENAVAYIGTIGPHVQLWMGQAWVGAGIGLGFVAGCANSCDAVSLSTSYDLRAGVSLSDDPSATGAANLSVELVSIPIGNVSAATISFLLGVQTF